MIKIAVDAMGGDSAPHAEVQGAVQAAQEYQVGVVLVGIEERIREELKKYRTEDLPHRGRSCQ